MMWSIAFILWLRKPKDNSFARGHKAINLQIHDHEFWSLESLSGNIISDIWK